MAKRIFIVTGGAGFIGSHIAARLLQDGHEVRVIDNLLTGKQSNLDYLTSLNGDYQYHNISITDADALIPVLKGAEVIFHEAAIPSVPRSIDNPLETHEHSATGTVTILHSAVKAGVRRVVYAASSSAYGEQEADFHRETMLPAPISPYGVAKLMGEYYAQVFTRVYGLETVALRYFNVFGTRQDPASQYAAVIPKFITRMLQGDAPIIYGDGKQSRDFTYIDNIVHGNLLAADAPDANGHVMNLAIGHAIDLLTLVDKINQALGTTIAPQLANERLGDILHSQADIKKAQTLLDFAPVVNFDEGLRRTIHWYQAQAKG